MPDTQAALTSAEQRLKDAAAPPAAVSRVKAPTYHVFRQTGGEGHFEHLTTGGPIKASSRKEATKTAAEQAGNRAKEAETFLVIAEKEFKLLTRKVATKVEETFD